MKKFKCSCKCGCELFMEVSAAYLHVPTGFWSKYLPNNGKSFVPKPAGFKCASCGKIILNTLDLEYEKLYDKL